MSNTDYNHADCAACGRLVIKENNHIPVGHRDNAPDGTEAVDLILCEGCRFGVLKELLSGRWSYSAHKVESDTDREESDA